MPWNSAHLLDVSVCTPGDVDKQQKRKARANPEPRPLCTADGSHGDLVHQIVPSIFRNHRIHVIDPKFTCIKNRDINKVNPGKDEDAEDLPDIEGEDIDPFTIPGTHGPTDAKDDASCFDECQRHPRLQAVPSRENDHVLRKPFEDQEAERPDGCEARNQEDA